MHRVKYEGEQCIDMNVIKAWSNQDKFMVGNLNWHNVKTMTVTVSTVILIQNELKQSFSCLNVVLRNLNLIRVFLQGCK